MMRNPVIFFHTFQTSFVLAGPLPLGCSLGGKTRIEWMETRVPKCNNNLSIDPILRKETNIIYTIHMGNNQHKRRRMSTGMSRNIGSGAEGTEAINETEYWTVFSCAMHRKEINGNERAAAGPSTKWPHTGKSVCLGNKVSISENQRKYSKCTTICSYRIFHGDGPLRSMAQSYSFLWPHIYGWLCFPQLQSSRLQHLFVLL